MKPILFVAVALLSSAAHANPLDDLAKAVKNRVKDTTRRTSTSTTTPADLGPLRTYSQAEMTANGLEIVGIRLGMSADEVRAALQAKSVRFVESDASPLTYPMLIPGANQERYEHQGKGFRVFANQNPGNPVGDVSIALTPEPSPRVYFMERTAQYAPGSTAARPWRDAVVEKYGKPVDDQQINRIMEMSWATRSGGKETRLPCGRTAPEIGFRPDCVQNLRKMIDRCGASGLYATASYTNGSAARNVDVDGSYVTGFTFRLVSYGMAEGVAHQLAQAAAVHKEHTQQQAQERASTQMKPEL